MTSKAAVTLGIDVTTTEFALAVVDREGNEGFASMPMEGQNQWLNDAAFPAFQLDRVPGMLNQLLVELQNDGWEFQASPGTASVACRQHDQVILDQQGLPLMPALSWQCNAATKEVAQLRELGVQDHVGTIEERFVLPKLCCVLDREPAFREQISTVFMTGDWIAQQLTGARTLSSSDALSNGLLLQSTRDKDDNVFETAKLDADWFPDVAASGSKIGTIEAGGSDAWSEARSILAGWDFAAGLGDNHASAVGCGMSDDHSTLVVSAGTSGTVNFACPSQAKLTDESILQFEFYQDDFLLLLMLAGCGDWYNRFRAEFASDVSLEQLNQLAAEVDLSEVRRVVHNDTDQTETFRHNFHSLPVGNQVADTQFSIALELLNRVRAMVEATRQADVADPSVVVLTGGLSQSEFFQQVFSTGINLLLPSSSVRLSGRTGPLRYKTSAYGALINAELPQHGSLAAIHSGSNRFPLKNCSVVADASRAQMEDLLETYSSQ